MEVLATVVGIIVLVALFCVLSKVATKGGSSWGMGACVFPVEKHPDWYIQLPSVCNPNLSPYVELKKKDEPNKQYITLNVGTQACFGPGGSWSSYPGLGIPEGVIPGAQMAVARHKIDLLREYKRRAGRH